MTSSTLMPADLRSDEPVYSRLLCGQAHLLVHLSLLILIQCTFTPSPTHWHILTVTILTLPEQVNVKSVCVWNVLYIHVCKLIANFKCLTANTRPTIFTMPTHQGHLSPSVTAISQQFHLSQGHWYNNPNTSMTPYSWERVKKMWSLC